MKIRFETRCSGMYTYSHGFSFLPVLDQAHDFNHPIHDYNSAANRLAPEHELRLGASAHW